MDKNKAYAYLLLGAVVLAGAGGFMLSDGELFSTESVVTLNPNDHSSATVAFSIIDSDNLNSDNEVLSNDGS